MKTVTKQASDSYRDRGSKFIGYLFPAEDEEQFENSLDKVRSKYPDATHHCYAYRLYPNQPKEFAQDDGEPSGTAGLPILNQLKSAELINVGLIVVRYYGGTKLGKSGLINAYGYTAELCISKAVFGRIIPTKNLSIIYPYERQNEIERLKTTFDLIELDSEYLAEVTLTMACPIAKSTRLIEKLENLAHLDIRFEILGDDFVTH